MLERLLYRELKNQIDNITDDDLRTFFSSQQRFSTGEVDKVQQVFSAQRPSVVLGYPRRDVNLPVYSIQLSNEREYQPGTFLGDFLGGIQEEELAELGGEPALLGGDLYGAMYMRELHILVYSVHPDTCLYMYELAKRCIMLARPRYNEEGVLRTMLYGEDLEPVQDKVFEKQAGDWLFRRVLRLQAIELFQIGNDPGLELAGPVREIRGVHVDQATGVEALVYPFGEVAAPGGSPQLSSAEDPETPDGPD